MQTALLTRRLMTVLEVMQEVIIAAVEEDREL